MRARRVFRRLVGRWGRWMRVPAGVIGDIPFWLERGQVLERSRMWWDGQWVHYCRLVWRGGRGGCRL